MEKADSKPLQDLAIVAEQLSHALRSPLSVVRGLLADLAAGYTLSKDDLVDGQAAAEQLLDHLNILRLFSLGTEFTAVDFQVSELVNQLPERCAQMRCPCQVSAKLDLQRILARVLHTDLQYLLQAIACCVLFQAHLSRRSNLKGLASLDGLAAPGEISSAGVVQLQDSSDNSRAQGCLTIRIPVEHWRFSEAMISQGTEPVTEPGVANKFELPLFQAARNVQSVEALLLIFADHVFQAANGNAVVNVPDNGIPEIRVEIPFKS